LIRISAFAATRRRSSSRWLWQEIVAPRAEQPMAAST
jgi:hypothetical protein